VTIELNLLSHLDAQIASARRLLQLVLEQGAAVRERDAEGVLARMGEIQGEMGRRAALELNRTSLLQEAGAALARPAHEVTLEALCTLVSDGAAELARQRSAELRGLLAEIAREHGINRALMRQELAFLDHLTRLIGAEPQTGYRPPAPAGAPAAARPAAARHRVLNVQA
jgi:FlgN protein